MCIRDRVYDGREISDRIFVAGGFAEVTRERCTVLAEVAMPVSEIDTGATEQDLRNAREDIAAASSDYERDNANRKADVAQAKLEAVRRSSIH